MLALGPAILMLAHARLHTRLGLLAIGAFVTAIHIWLTIDQFNLMAWRQSHGKWQEGAEFQFFVGTLTLSAVLIAVFILMWPFDRRMDPDTAVHQEEPLAA